MATKRTAKSKAKPARKPVKKAPTKRAKAGANVEHELTRAIKLMNWVHEMTGRFVADFPPEKACWQGFPSDNHLLWTVGHLATCYDWASNLLGETTPACPSSYGPMFAYKSTPHADASKYPSLDEVRTVHHRAYAQLQRAMERTKPGDIHKPCLGETYGFCSSRIDLIYKVIWHEGWHQGQLATLRRELNLPPI
jgi:hypothetical protein